MSDSQRVMHWRLIIEEFGPNIQHIAGFDNKVADTLSRLPSTPSNKNEPFTRKSQCRVNELFVIDREDNNENCFLIKILIVQIEQQNN